MLTDRTRRVRGSGPGRSRRASAPIGASVLALESRPGRALLDCRPLTGRSAACACATRRTINALHQTRCSTPTSESSPGHESCAAAEPCRRRPSSRRWQGSSTGPRSNSSGSEPPLEGHTLREPSHAGERVAAIELIARDQQARYEADGDVLTALLERRAERATARLPRESTIRGRSPLWRARRRRPARLPPAAGIAVRPRRGHPGGSPVPAARERGAEPPSRARPPKVGHGRAPPRCSSARHPAANTCWRSASPDGL